MIRSDCENGSASGGGATPGSDTTKFADQRSDDRRIHRTAGAGHPGDASHRGDELLIERPSIGRRNAGRIEGDNDGVIAFESQRRAREALERANQQARRDRERERHRHLSNNQRDRQATFAGAGSAQPVR